MSGKLITFEGIDGSGKSEQVILLKKFLEEQNKKVKVLREPGSTNLGEEIRDIILKKEKFKNIEVETEFLLFSASRSEMISKKVIPLLKNGYFVIMDRFYDSSTVYQGTLGGIPIHEVDNINNFVVKNIHPNITFLLDIDVQTAINRQKNREDNDNFDNKSNEYYQKLRSIYISIAKENTKRIKVINANKGINEINNDIVSIVKEKFLCEEIIND